MDIVEGYHNLRERFPRSNKLSVNNLVSGVTQVTEMISKTIQFSVLRDIFDYGDDFGN